MQSILVSGKDNGPFELRAQPPQFFCRRSAPQGGLPHKERKHENLPICNSFKIIEFTDL